MQIQFGLFLVDVLLQKGTLSLSSQERLNEYPSVSIRHCLKSKHAELVLEVFENGQRTVRSTLSVPIQESEDWESIELAQYTLAFKCAVNA